MTRKHYRVFASIISRMRKGLFSGDIHGNILINELETICVEEFAKDNPRFNATKFREAAR